MGQIRVINVQHGCVNDGPGVRTSVFLKGCPLKCPWCCNPESIDAAQQYFIDEKKCLRNKNINSPICSKCIRNGGMRTLSDCPFAVAELVSQDYSEQDLFDVLLKDKPLYIESNGGVTFSGGEPLLQADCLVSLLPQLKKEGIHIAVETTLVAPISRIKRLLPFMDLWIVDLKLQPEMHLTGRAYLNGIKKRLSHLNGTNVCFRVVYVDSLSDYSALFVAALKDLGIDTIEVLQCHGLGKLKYDKLGLEFTDYSASINKMDSFVEKIRKEGLFVNKLYV